MTLTIVCGDHRHSGQNGTIGYNPNLGGTTDVTVVNEGTISADVSGGTITVYGTDSQNTGTLEPRLGARSTSLVRGQ